MTIWKSHLVLIFGAQALAKAQIFDKVDDLASENSLGMEFWRIGSANPR
jgi:hypothetical protein